MVCCAVLALATALITGRLGFFGSTWNASGLREHWKPEITLTSELPGHRVVGHRDIRLQMVGAEHPYALHRDVAGPEADRHLAIHEGRILRRNVHHSGRARGQRGQAESLQSAAGRPVG